MTLPLPFRNRWQAFFMSTLPDFLGYSSYVSATPIVKAIIGFSRLALAFLIVWLIGMLLIKVFKEIFL